MNIPDVEIVSVSRREQIESDELGTGRFQPRPSPGGPLELEASCHRCGHQWIAKKARRVEIPGTFARLAGVVRVTCPNCKAYGDTLNSELQDK